MPDADMTPDVSAPETGMPEELKRQQAEEVAKKTQKRLDSRIRSLTEVIQENEDGTKHHLREIIEGYIALGEFPFLQVLCDKLGFEYEKVRAAIAKRDGNPNREPFANILLEVEKVFNKARGVFLREILVQIATHEPEKSEDGLGDTYHVKDKMAAIKLWHQLINAPGTSLEDLGDGEGGLAYPDGLDGHLNPEPSDE